MPRGGVKGRVRFRGKRGTKNSKKDQGETKEDER